MRLCMPFVVTVVLIGGLAAPPAACASITAPDWNEPIVLKLKDGRQLSGRYHGDVGFPENVDYAERYEAWLVTFGPQAAPALGESLVVARPGAPPIRGAFRGFAEGRLLLGTADSCLDLVVPLGNHVEVRRAAEEAPDSDWLAARKLWNSAPSAYAIVLQTTDGIRVAIPRTVIAKLSTVHEGGGDVAAGLVMGVIIGALIGGALAAAGWASAFWHAMI